MKKIFTLLLMLLPFVASAHDFEVYIDGTHFYFNLLSKTECELTCETSRTGCYRGRICIPSKVTYADKELDVVGIGKSAFKKCTGLDNVEIPNSITYIGAEAFYGCNYLYGISLPNSITSIGKKAFYSCINLKRITLSNSITSIGSDAFESCWMLSSIKLPENITRIEDGTFYGCNELTSVEFSNNITSIGEYAFRSCCKLTSIELPNSITSIGGSAFAGCYELTSIELPNSITSIGGYAFRECPALKEVKVLAENPPTMNGSFDYAGKYITKKLLIPQGTKEKYESAEEWKDFWDIVEFDPNAEYFDVGGIYYHVTSIPNKTVEVTYKGDSGYSYTDRYSGDVVIPEKVRYNSIEFSVTGIGIDAFLCCTGVTSVTIPNSVTSIGNGAFYDCEGLTSVNLPEGITTIGDNTFEYCYCLTSVIIPNNVTSIGRRAFISCKALTSISIPNSVTSIEEYAFTNCMSLTSIVLPTNLESLNPGLFMFCTALKDVTVHWETPYNISELKLFKDCDLSDATLHVPAGSADAYKAAEGWKEFGNIVAITNGDDAIEEITLDQQSDLIYNLDGVKVDNNYRGISIRNGKKVLVK